MPDKKTKHEVRKALARAETFWGIICGADITRGLGGKILDKVQFDALSNPEKMTLVKVSTHMMQGANEIEKEFAQTEETQSEVNGETETQKQIDINEGPQETRQAAPEDNPADEETEDEETEQAPNAASESQREETTA